MQWTLPNILTVARLVAAPAVAFALVLLPQPLGAWAALALFIGASLTDFLDGYLARKWNQTSKFGAMLDPIADKAMVVTALAVIMALSGLDAWVTIPAALILFREVFVSGLREFLGADAGKLAVTNLAKWKTTAQMVAIATVLAAFALRAAQAAPPDQVPSYAGVYLAGVALLWVAAGLTVITGWDYFKKSLPFLREDP